MVSHSLAGRGSAAGFGGAGFAHGGLSHSVSQTSPSEHSPFGGIARGPADFGAFGATAGGVEAQPVSEATRTKNATVRMTEGYTSGAHPELTAHDEESLALLPIDTNEVLVVPRLHVVATPAALADAIDRRLAARALHATSIHPAR
jgi:hypothetical protein